MQNIITNKNDAGQRLDKFLGKYLKEAPKSFFYKMLRKKNITLNGKKATGNEILQTGDEIRLFLSDETISKFKGTIVTSYPVIDLDIVYEDEDLIFLNKPAGMLSQKADDKTPSMVEYLIGYLLKNGSIQESDLERFKPSVCNRLDRNTSGLIAAGKSLRGLQFLSDQFKRRDMKKYYLALVKGRIEKPEYLKGILVKNAKTNQVHIRQVKEGERIAEGMVETEFQPVAGNERMTLLKVHLITGKTHQIRAHLSGIGHPIAGDPKYGDPTFNRYFEQNYHLKHQLLHAGTLYFPAGSVKGDFSYLCEKEIQAPLPKDYRKVLEKEKIGENR